MAKTTENPSELEKQSAETSLHATKAIVDEPPLEEHTISIDHMDVDPATTKPPSPIKPTKANANDVIITGLGYTTPDNPTVLSKHSAKEEIFSADKGKWSVNLESYAQYSAQEIHSGYMNPLHTSRDFEAGLVNLMKERFEAELNVKDSQVDDLQENIKSQQSETSKAKVELTTALAEMEKLKKDFKADRTSWESDKAALLKRSEEAETALKPVAEELSGLKHQINTMTDVVFGSKIAHLGADMHMKLKAAYTLIEQLYTDTQRAISATSHKKQPPTLIKDTLEKLSMLPQQVEDLK